MAAKMFAKAAVKGSAEGLYNLALLMTVGKGVQKNVQESFRLLELAANQDIVIEMNGIKSPNIGVVQAEHMIGHRYHQGVGVGKDLQKAFEWYTRAIKHEGGMAANNIGIMYQIGEGVNQDRQMAINYFKLSASREVVRSMESLAYAYLEMGDKENATKWFQFAIYKGSIALQSKKQVFVNFVGSASKLNQPFESDIFELQLIEEVKNGPLKHLIVDYGLDAAYDEITSKNYLKDLNVEKLTGEATSRQSNGLTDPYRVSIIKIGASSNHSVIRVLCSLLKLHLICYQDLSEIDCL